MGFLALSDSVVIWGSPLVPAHTPSWALAHTLQPACAANPAWCSWRQGDARYLFFFPDCKWFLFFAPQNIRCGAQSAEKAAQTSVCVCACVCVPAQPTAAGTSIRAALLISGSHCSNRARVQGGGRRRRGGNNPSGLKARLNRRHIGVYVHMCSTYSQFAEICPCLLKKKKKNQHQKSPGRAIPKSHETTIFPGFRSPTHIDWCLMLCRCWICTPVLAAKYFCFVKGLQKMCTLNGSFSMHTFICLGTVAGGDRNPAWVCQAQGRESSRKLLCVYWQSFSRDA